MLNLSHKKLDVYKLALRLLQKVYRVTRCFPKEEQFVLISQVRRSAISVCSNIAKGASRISGKEKKRFYEIARSSLVEMDTQPGIARLLDYCKYEPVAELGQILESVFRMLSKMIGNLTNNPPSKPH